MLEHLKQKFEINQMLSTPPTFNRTQLLNSSSKAEVA